MDKLLTYIFLLFVCYCNALTQEDINYKAKMKDAVNNGNFNFALNIYAAAQEDDYYDLEELQRLSCQCYYALKDYSQAEIMSGKLFDEDENSNLTDMIYMCVASKHGTVTDSLITRTAMQMGEKQLEKSILLQMACLDKKDIDRASSAINRYILKKNIEDKEELKSLKTVLTVMYFYCGRYTDAYNSSIDYLTMDNQPVIYYILGILRERRQEYSSAISFFTMAIKNGYNHYDAYLQRAICKGYEQNYVSSNTDLDTCIMIDSNYYAFYLKGVNYCHLHSYQDAMLNFDYSITLNDTFADSYNYRGIAYTNLGEYAFAVSDFQRAVALDKKTPFVHNNLGMALEKNGKLPQAIQEYELSVKYEPYFEGGWYNLGRIYTEYGMNTKAIRYLLKAAEIEPEISDVYYLLGINYKGKGDKKTACGYFNQALELNHTEVQTMIDNYCNKETVVNDKRKKPTKKDKLKEDDGENYTEEDTDEDNNPSYEDE